MSSNDYQDYVSTHENTLRVLVVDDNPKHREAAKKQLAGRPYEVTVANSMSEAQTLLGRGNADENPANFDVVLTDLMLPAELVDLSGNPRQLDGSNPQKELVGSLQPAGFVLALYAARRGIRHVALLTDSGHHNSPFGFWIEQMLSNDLSSKGRKPFLINGSSVAFLEAEVRPGEEKNWLNCLVHLRLEKFSL